MPSLPSYRPNWNIQRVKTTQSLYTERVLQNFDTDLTKECRNAHLGDSVRLRVDDIWRKEETIRHEEERSTPKGTRLL